MSDPLDDDARFLRHVGPARGRDFARLGVRTIRDLLYAFPRDMSDRSSLHRIADCPEGEASTVLASAVAVSERSIPRRGGKGGRLKITTAELSDDSGKFLEVSWFNQPWLKGKMLRRRMLVHGKGHWRGARLVMDHPLYQIVPEEDAQAREAVGGFARVVPIYPCAGGLTQSIWRTIMTRTVELYLSGLEEPLPVEMVARLDLPGIGEAIRNLHFPGDAAAWRRARLRLAWDECLFFHLTLLAARRHALLDLPGRQFRIGPELDNRIRRLFPFRLTPGQDRAIREITRDMESPLPMQRLLQGDVGCGKTAVAAYALLAAVANRAQACIMAPTSLLARQHFDTFERILANSSNARVRMNILTGGMPAAERALVVERLANGGIDIVCATHSAIGGSVAFRDLGLVVIDEQHKFGVRQRYDLVRKGVRPDTLIMTATPIPRSLALSVYGDLDLSVIDTLPPGRKPVRTLLFPQSRREQAWEAVRNELRRGRQAFVVCPLVGEGEERLDVKSAEAVLEGAAKGKLAGFRLAQLNGRMARGEQERIMDDFRSGRIDALVSTIVVEVGVDVPNATVILVEQAERFGLAQLHQLRGRVGRGTEPGICILLSDAREGEAGARLAALLAHADGFAIAEADLAIRGPGEFVGARQHGWSGLRLVDPARDIDLLREAREEALRLLEVDPDLVRREHLFLRRELVRRYGKLWDRAAGL
ncbi:MAG: ATP-dependent DNA helicase RecG [Planctomycetota bacterium]|nr:ATP-dependent DNA helicase RecG [Planctomycetota bacterium]